MNKKIFTWTGLIFYTIILSLLMIFYRLPADKLIASTLDRYSDGRLLFKAEKTAYIFPSEYRMEEISFGLHLGETPISDHLRSLSFGPDYGALFSGYLPIKIKGLMSRGDITAKVGISIRDGLNNGYLSINFNDLYLDDLNIFKSFSDRALKGKMKGELSLEGDLIDPANLHGKGRFMMKEGAIGTKIDIPGMNEVPFNNLQIDFSIKNGMISLKKSEMTGPLFSGKFFGEIKLKKKIVESRINIRGEMSLGPLAGKNQFIVQFIKKIRKNKGPFIIKMEGTLERPIIFWSKS